MRNDNQFRHRRRFLHAANHAASPLARRFGAPPFTVLDARQGYWRRRRVQWEEIGFASCEGRAAKLWADSPSGYDPQFLERKRATENRLGRKLSTAEFIADHYDPSVSKHNGTSEFDPVLAELLVRWFAPVHGSVLDPFAGGSVRGVVSTSLDRAYTGIDLRPEQIEANRRQAVELSLDPTPTWIVGDARCAAQLVGSDFLADCILTCPPYADLEVYSDDPRDLSTMEFDAFVESIKDAFSQAISVLAEDRFCVCVIGDVRDRTGMLRGVVSKVQQAIEDAGVRLYNHAVLLTPGGSAPMRAGRQFSASRKLVTTHQHILVFLKGDAKRAATAMETFDREEEDPLQQSLFE